MENNNYRGLNYSREKLEVINQIKEIYDFIQQKKFIKLIPEVRTNIAGALHDAKTRDDVAGIDGRITIVNGMPKAAGEIKFGVAEHTARLILSAKNFDKSVNFVMNLKYIPELIEDIMKKSDLEVKEINREKEPEELKPKEFSTMQWLIKESVDKTGKILDIIWDRGSIGKEPMMRLFGKDSADIIEKLQKIFKLTNNN
ncbi:MAG: thiamine-phosphate synthase family protein [Promethearchaeota archaeon]|jgi:predicted fused transcriptional regulator/phosphomethylpyrimidine kinase